MSKKTKIIILLLVLILITLVLSFSLQQSSEVQQSPLNSYLLPSLNIVGSILVVLVLVAVFFHKKNVS